MPRSLSGVRSGEFDTIEVTEKVTAQDLETQGKITAQDLETQGSFSHTGATAPLFSTLRIGQNPAEPAGSVVLKVDGDISCANFVTTGIEHTLAFTLADGVTTKTYDGSADVTLTATEMTPAPTTPSTLTVTRGGNSYQSYDTLADTAIDIPVLPTLTLKQGTTTLGTYSTADTTIAIATPIVATLTHSSTQSIDIDDNPSLVHSGYGLTLTNLPSNTKVKVDVQVWVANPTSTKEEVFVALTKSKTSFSTNYAREVALELPATSQKLATYSKVLTLSGTCHIGLAVDTKDPETGVNIKLGGDFPDVIMSATIVDHTSTTYVAPSPPSDDY